MTGAGTTLVEVGADLLMGFRDSGHLEGARERDVDDAGGGTRVSLGV